MGPDAMNDADINFCFRQVLTPRDRNCLGKVSTP